MPNLDDLTHFLTEETGLATISTTQSDGRVLSSVANCGIVAHPVSKSPTVALVSLGQAARLSHIRRGSEVTIAVRRGWSWVAVTGPAELIGPRDQAERFDAESRRLLLREIFAAAGGVHEDLVEYDRVMAEQERTAVLVSPLRIIGNVPQG